MNSQHGATLIRTYTLTMTNTDDFKISLYDDLVHFLSSVYRDDKLILVGDFNAYV